MLISTPVWAQQNVSGGMEMDSEFHISRWSIDEGLPQNSVNDIIQTNDGYLWLATFGGLSRFDGTEFKNYEIANTEGLGSNRIVELYEDRSGRVWIGHEGTGVTIYEDGKFNPFLPGSAIDELRVNKIIQDDDSTMWFGTNRGLYSYRKGELSVIDESDGLVGNQIGKLYIGKQGQIIISTGISGYTEKGIGIVKGNKVISVAKYPQGTIYSHYFYDYDDYSWIAMADYILKHDPLGNRTKIEFSIPDGINNMFKDREGNIWIGSSDLHLASKDALNQDKLITTRFPEIQNVGIKRVFEDNQGNIWVGTNGNGLYRINKKPINFYRTITEAGARSFDPVSEDGYGGIYLGRRCGGLFHFSNGEFKPVGTSEDCIAALFLDTSNKDLYIASGSLVEVLSEGKLRPVLNMGNMGYYGQINAIHKSGQAIWIGTTGNGLYKFDIQTENLEEIQVDLVSKQIMDIFEDSKGDVWVGYTSGLAKISGSRITTFDNSNDFIKAPIRSIFEDSEEVMWFGTYGAGVIRLKDGEFNLIDQNEGLCENAVSRISEDVNGNLWFLGNQGLSVVSKESIHSVIDGDRPAIDCLLLGTSEGMVEGNGSGSVAQSKDGKTWWPTILGVASIDINKFKSNPTAPKVYVRQVKVENKVLDQNSQNLVLGTDQRDLEVEYVGLNYSFPQRVKFAHLLEGHDEEWVEDGFRNIVTYTNLEPGDYTLRVKASNEYNVWSDEIALMTVKVTPKYYQTTWFLILAILSSIAIPFFIYRARTIYLTRRQAELKEIVRNRTKELQETNLALKKGNEELEKKGRELSATIHELQEAQQQLIHSEKMASLGTMSAGVAHEINNPLNFIKGGLSGLIQFVKENPGDEEGISKYSEIMNDGVNRVANIVQSLGHFSREGSSMDEQCDMNEILDNCLVILHNKLKDKVEVVKNYSSEPVIIQGNEGKLHQALINLISNAEQAIEKSGTIVLTTEKTDKYTTVRIADDGVGIPSNHQYKIRDPFFTTKGPGEGTGLGLSITYEIIENHSGSVHLKSEVGVGTEFFIKFPVNSVKPNGREPKS